jgi:hypothetical protein
MTTTTIVMTIPKDPWLPEIVGDGVGDGSEEGNGGGDGEGGRRRPHASFKDWLMVYWHPVKAEK